jgi:hypothetical protein
MHPDVSKLGSCLLMHHGQETTEAIENLEPWTEELRKWNQSGLESIKTAWQRVCASMPAPFVPPADMEAS